MESSKPKCRMLARAIDMPSRRFGRHYRRRRARWLYSINDVLRTATSATDVRSTLAAAIYLSLA
jgi:hypothetical protein